MTNNLKFLPLIILSALLLIGIVLHTIFIFLDINRSSDAKYDFVIYSYNAGWLDGSESTIDVTEKIYSDISIDSIKERLSKDSISFPYSLVNLSKDENTLVLYAYKKGWLDGSYSTTTRVKNLQGKSLNGRYFFDPWIVLPSRMYNIGDTISFKVLKITK